MPGKPFIGKCMDMCPRPEVEMRTKQRLLHRLERGDNLHPVKEFTRSAAGNTDESPLDIRPPEVLQTTVNYLLYDIATKENTIEAFEFISNRLRSVRLDLFKQQCKASVSLPILEPIARYYAWAAYWYCEEPTFDRYLHDIQLLECLKDCLRLADDCNHPTSPDIESLYVLFSLGDNEGLIRAITINAKNNIPLLYQCQVLSVYWYLGNFVAVCKKIKELPVLLAALVSVKHLEFVRRHALQVMSTSHSCKNNVTPLGSLVEAQLFASEEDAAAACKHYGITIENSGICFKRASFKATATVRNFTRPVWIQEKLNSIQLPDLFFNEPELV